MSSSGVSDSRDSFREWTTNCGLEESTHELLTSHGFKNIQSVKLIKTEDIALMDVQPLAQRRLLEAAITEAKERGIPAAASPTRVMNLPSNASQDAQPVSASAAAALLQLGIGQQNQRTPQNQRAHSPERPTAETTTTGERQLPERPPRHLDVVDFVRNNDCMSERVLLTDNDKRTIGDCGLGDIL